MKYVIKLLLMFFLISAAQNLSGQQWEFEYEKEGIKIYTRRIEGSSFKEYKGVGVIDVKVWTIAALMDDLDAYPDWNGNCIHARVVVPRKNNVMIQYFVNSAPWPVKGRDVLLKTHQHVQLDNMGPDKNNGVVIKIDITSIQDDTLVPPVPEYVRIKELTGTWVLEGIEGGKTRLTYTIRTDIGGKVPDAVGNLVSKSLPYDTIVNIRKMTGKEKYQILGREYTKIL